MEYFYLVGIKVDGKLVSVSPEKTSLSEIHRIQKNLNTAHTKYVAIRCYELESD